MHSPPASPTFATTMFLDPKYRLW